jgi:Na+/melibiose symporter-like transporter
MLLRVLWVLIGYLVACIAFALVLVAFVFTPAELASADADRFSMAGFQLLASSIQVIMFAAPLALVVTAIAEWRGTVDWIFYALAAMLIAGVGFLAQYASELQGAPTIVNNYAFTAFMTGGFVAGVIYWLMAGRSAGGRSGAAGDSAAAKST